MSFAVNYHQWIIDEFEPYLGKTVAEVGAGIGSVSRLLLGKQIKRLFAFEPSLNMYPYLEKELQQDDRAKAINDFFSQTHKNEGFDSVVYINVLEHIENDRTELVNALEILKTQGYLLVFVPALSWLYSRVDQQLGHFRRYTKKALRQQLIGAGYYVPEIRYHNTVGALAWLIVARLMHRDPTGGAPVKVYDSLFVPVLKRLEGTRGAPFGQSLFAVATWPGGS